MKKILSIILILSLVFGLGVLFTGCGKSEPYSNYDLSEYVTLPDYNTYEITVPNVEITDADIEDAIQKNLEAATTTEKVTEGTVDEGDTVTVAFEGTLEDGTKSEGMKSEGSSLTLGSGQFIPGFEEGLYGATIGEEVTLDLKFPDPYQNNEELSGKGVTFKVTVKDKQVKKVPEFNEDFVKNNSDFETIEEYRTELVKALEKAEYEDQLYTIKFDLYSKIVEETEVIKYPDKEVKNQTDVVKQTYKDEAKAAGAKWEDYLKNTLKVSEDEFNKMSEDYAKEVIKQEMIIYSVAAKEEVVVSDEEYEEYLNSLLISAGYKDAETFKTYTGMSIEEYAETYMLDRDLLLTKELDKIYERLASK